MPQEIKDAYSEGAGSEIPTYEDDICSYRWHGKKKVPAKIQAIHSSSALVCNAFAYWYEHADRSPLQKALGCLLPIQKMKFEDTMPTGLSGIPPHLDVVLYCGNMVYAIESKFSEPYQQEKVKVDMGSKSYSAALWRDIGLSRCADLVDKINNGDMNGQFRFLSVNQLLKHTLGLSKQRGNNFELIYLWFEKPGMRESDEHRMEILQFCSLIGNEIAFRSITYQKLFENLKGCCDCSHHEYLEKFSRRYL